MLEKENVRLKRLVKVSTSNRQHRSDIKQPSDCWSIDFVHDNIYDGKKLRILNIVDNFSRYCRVVGVRHSDKSTDVIDTLNTAIERFGKLQRIQRDNGSEVISKEFDLWAYGKGIELDFSKTRQTDRQCVCGVF